MRTQKTIQALNEAFGPADGSADTYQLLVGGQPMLDPANVQVSSVWQVNWQGTQLLYEIPRTNLVANSTSAAWTQGGSGSAITTTANAGVAPDGSNSMINFTKPVGQRYMQPCSFAALPVGSPAIGSVFAKQGTAGGRYLALRLQANYPNRVDCTYDLVAGTFVLASTNSVGISSVRAGMVQYPNGVWRCWLAAVGGSTGWGTFYATPVDASTRQVDSVSTAVCDVLLWEAQGMAMLQLSSQIHTAGASVTQTDYSYVVDQVTFGYVPVLNSTFLWNGSAQVEQLDASATLLAQYANSPVLTALVAYFNEWLDPNADLDNFYNLVWNVETAQGFGLDIWGVIVDVPRTIQLLPPNTYFGYKEALPGSYPFNNQPYYSGPQQGSQYTLSDPAYRILIMTKALANISSFTAPSVNNLLRYLFAGRGSCYVLELSPMQIQYVFNFALEPWESSVLQQPQLMPRPAGVGVTITVNP